MKDLNIQCGHNNDGKVCQRSVGTVALQQDHRLLAKREMRSERFRKVTLDMQKGFASDLVERSSWEEQKDRDSLRWLRHRLGDEALMALAGEQETELGPGDVWLVACDCGSRSGIAALAALSVTALLASVKDQVRRCRTEQVTSKISTLDIVDQMIDTYQASLHS